MIADLAPVDERPATIPQDARYLRLAKLEGEWVAAREEINEVWGGLDVLVNNAGIAQGGRIEMLTEEDWRLITDINLLGVARGCRTFRPSVQGAGTRPHTQHCLAGRARAPAHDVLVHRGQSCCGGDLREPALGARAVRRGRLGGLPVVSAPTWPRA